MPRKPHEKLPSSATELDGLTKAAVLMLFGRPRGRGQGPSAPLGTAVEEVARAARQPRPGPQGCSRML